MKTNSIINFIKNRKFIDQCVESFTDSVNDGIIVFDKDKNCIYQNTLAKQITDNELNIASILSNSDHPFHKVFTVYIESDVKYVSANYTIVADGSYLILHDVTDIETSNREQQYKARHDIQTQLYNVHEFCKQSKGFALFYRNDGCVFLSIRIDNLMETGHILGSNTSDYRIEHIASFIKEYADGNGIYGRTSDHMFSIMLPAFCFNEQDFIDRFFEHLRMNYQMNKTRVSIFACNVNADNYDEADLNIMSFVHTAMYAPTSNNKLTWISPEKNENYNYNLDDGTFFIYPYTNAAGHSCGGSILIKVGDDIEPQFLHRSFLYHLGAISFEGLIIDIAELNCDDSLFVSIPLSALNIYNYAITKIIDNLADTVDTYHLPRTTVRFEIQASDLLLNTQTSYAMVDCLYEHGFEVELAISDFNELSLDMLTSVRFRSLKMDIRLLSDLGETKLHLLTDVLHIISETGRFIIATNVKSKEDFILAQNVGCNLFQGFYSEPLPFSIFKQKYIQIGGDVNECN